jgi:hypothetical protein
VWLLPAAAEPPDRSGASSAQQDQERHVPSESRWRAYSIVASLIAASSTTLVEIGLVVSWFHNGGSPHGMAPSPGLWKTLGPIFRCTMIASVALAVFGKKESTDVCPRVDSCNSRRNYADLLVGNGLTGRPAFSAGWRNIAIALIGLRRAPCKSRRLSLAVFSTVSRSADRAAHSLKDDGGRRHSDWS